MDTIQGFSYPMANSGEDWIWCLFHPNPIDFGTKIRLQHATYFNVVCCDGHVLAVPVTTLFNPLKTAQNWNVDHQPHTELWGFYIGPQ